MRMFLLVRLVDASYVVLPQMRSALEAQRLALARARATTTH
jgi:hypothetical protein